MPQPMSTPTAAGETASRMAITLPTVAPLPRCTSGITRSFASQGRREIARSWSRASGSTVVGSAHMRVSLVVPGTGTGSSVMAVSMVSPGRPGPKGSSRGWSDPR